jgi:hypothetical protein
MFVQFPFKQVDGLQTASSKWKVVVVVEVDEDAKLVVVEGDAASTVIFLCTR